MGRPGRQEGPGYLGTGGWVVVSPGVPVVTSSPPRRPASSSPPPLGAPRVAIASSPAFHARGCTCRISAVASPLRVAASSHPHRYTHRTAILTSSPPRARRRVVVAVSPLHGWGWHLHGVAPTRRRALLRACSPLAHLFQTGMSCRAVCMFVPHRAAHAARRRVVYLVAHLVAPAL